MQASRSAEGPCLAGAAGPGAAPEDKDLTLFVACYNEEGNIEITLDTLLAALREVDLSWEILIIDDASRDRSVAVIQEYIARHPGLPIRLHINEQNQGLGYNYMLGASLGTGRYYRLICGDNTEPKETFVKVFRQIGKADIIVPFHRRCTGKPLLRRALSRIYTFLVNRLSGYRLHYYNGLAVHLRRNILRCPANSQGFGFQADIMTRLLDLGASYVEVEVQVQERTEGKSKALTTRNLSSVTRTLLGIVGRRLTRAYHRILSRTAAPTGTEGQGFSAGRVTPSPQTGGLGMGIYDAIWNGPGYHTGLRLTQLELQAVRAMITRQYLERLKAVAPELVEEAASLGMDNYHHIQNRLEHGSAWQKKFRLLPTSDAPALKQMGFYQKLVQEFGPILASDEELIWRLVRPQSAEDVGPLHTENWFWNLGYSQAPPGYESFRLWIPVFAEPGQNGLCVVPDSQRREWKHHTEIRHGIPKPMIDENVDELDVRPLPLGPGEMVLFHGDLLHGGMFNRGNRCRVSLEMTIFFRKEFASLRPQDAAAMPRARSA